MGNIGAKDRIDELLVQKYADEKVNNFDNLPSLVDAETMIETMNDFANMQKSMLAMQQKLQNFCAGINAKSAQYRASRT